jgi:hypothetical protein
MWPIGTVTDQVKPDGDRFLALGCEYKATDFPELYKVLVMSGHAEERAETFKTPDFRARIVNESGHVKLDALGTKDMLELGTIYDKIPKEGQQIRSAYAYQIMKRVAGRVGVIDSTEDRAKLREDLELAMMVITGHKQVPTREDK